MFHTFCRTIATTAVMVGLLGARHAYAGCEAANPVSAGFGTVASFDVANRAQSTSSTNIGLSCGGGLATLLVIGNSINGTITSANGGKMTGPNGDAIPYSMFADDKHQISLAFGLPTNWASTQLISILGLGGKSVPLPLYLRTNPGSNVAAGTYSDTLTIRWDWHVCSGIGFIFCIGWDDGSASKIVSVTLTVANDCTIDAPDVSFGAAPTVATFASVNGSLSLTCTKGMIYSVGLSPGNHAAANGRRQMASGANRLQYDLFGGGGSTAWGQSSNRASSAGAANGASTQQFPYVARIYTDQATPPVGTYTDSVIVDVRY
ncbi:Csu type fimbrial protein [Burkholderia ubonensis]|uniref:SCPU domain-containing protein n=1 Tax=Burkholderia ubonensis TaxID=101571 RepID=A0AB74DD93_9BURK|nr:spore coat U domain-containing protein [Burkholderia ubonensis]PAJ77991.1 hypothetical protein CJO71_26100 [Burkholderia ubonensis]PAJ83737.1 hypothetical protein CJO70_30625 [Burkholderia ubonensis]PAJ90987.1 hypothetical protein CJO69_29385 [Burkholderia ubonensis]PAJ97318.1 hypothetical protein CJO68_31010 [Burkholderia ubonensis]PAK04182.1 hypothetical protein CJO67_29500 [Burkholderia ubonensis]